MFCALFSYESQKSHYYVEFCALASPSLCVLRSVFQLRWPLCMRLVCVLFFCWNLYTFYFLYGHELSRFINSTEEIRKRVKKTQKPVNTTIICWLFCLMCVRLYIIPSRSLCVLLISFVVATKTNSLFWVQNWHLRELVDWYNFWRYMGISKNWSHLPHDRLEFRLEANDKI